jgi:membrane protease YdiL (CAAX protease family)
VVAVGEELLFRGYLQSSFNLIFGKTFKVENVTFGWGLILSALLFGLIHSLAATPIAWPWMLFTFVGGLILGFVREKDGSLLAPIILHMLMDFPLIFMT